MLAPFWAPFRIGPYLRNEPDKRTYVGFFRSDKYLRGIKRQYVLVTAQKIEEEDAARAGDDAVVRFAGLGRYFTPLLSEHTLIRRALWEMTVPAMRDAGDQFGGRYIAMHVRRGDITRIGYSPERMKAFSVYTPLQWFLAVGRTLQRQLADRSVPIVVFTDGAEEEIAPLRELDNVRIKGRQSAITDLWAMSHARLLVATGYSTFSMWASYLGGMPTIYAPGKIQERVQIGRPSAIEMELAPDAEIPIAALEGV